MSAHLYRETENLAPGAGYRPGCAPPPEPVPPPPRYIPPPPTPWPPPDEAAIRRAREMAKARGLWNALFGADDERPALLPLDHEDFSTPDPDAPRTRVEWRPADDDEVPESAQPARDRKAEAREMARHLTRPREQFSHG